MFSVRLPFAAWSNRFRARHALIGCGIAVGLVLAAGAAALVTLAQHDSLQDARRDLHNLAFLLSEETCRGFAAADHATTDLIALLRQDGVTTPSQFDAWGARHDLARRIVGLPYVNGIALVTPDGRLAAASPGWPVSATDPVAQRYFRALAGDPPRPPRISTPVHKDAAPAVLLASDVRSPAGSLLGFAAVSLDLASFQRLFSQVVIGPGASVALWRDDGVLLVRHPHQDAIPPGTNYGPLAAFRESMAERDRGLVEHPSLIDGVPRLVAPRSVGQFPLLLAVTESVAAVAVQSRPWVLAMTGATVLTEVVLAAIVMLGLRRLRDQERLNAARAAAVQAEAARALAESELQRERDQARHDQAARQDAMRFNQALGNMVQGLVMFDGNARLTVVNQRLSVLLGLPEHVLHPGMDYDSVVQAIIQYGNIPKDEVLAAIDRRKEMIAQHKRDRMIWELVDGRVFAITHQPMEEGWLAAYDDVSERRRADARLAYIARHDALTSLPNRAMFHERLELALAFARRGRLIALHCLDLDQFKTVNDTLGHPVGDCLLQSVAQRLAGQVRDVDTFARLGGDEFGIIQTAIDKPSDAAGLANRVIEIMDRPFVIGGHDICINASIGIALSPQDGTDADTLLKNADLALYRAKVDGRRTWRLFQADMDTELQARRSMEMELRTALACGQFELFYQPLIAVATRSPSGFEALLRWRHPTKGLVSPATFIPLAEETGLIVPIGDWVLRTACATAMTWPGHLRVAVNLSPVQFGSRDIIAMVTAALRQSGLPPERLELEITESAMMAETSATVATLHAFRSLGVHIAMDDFGTGYSSLSYLRRFPFDRIKIDQSFIRELGRQRDCGAIVRAIISLSRELGIAVTAEGVETPEQLRALVLARCTDLQGYLFSPPVPQQDVRGLLLGLEAVTELMPPVGLVA